MRSVRIVLILAVAVLIASPLLAKEAKKKAAKPAPCPADQYLTRMLGNVTLTAEQKTQIDALKKEFGPKLKEARKKVDDVLTADQKKARGEAMKKAKADGKTGKEAAAAVAAAVKLTDDQKAKQAEAQKAVSALTKELDKAARDLLTPEQKASLKKKAGEGKKAKKAK